MNKIVYSVEFRANDEQSRLENGGIYPLYTVGKNCSKILSENLTLKDKHLQKYYFESLDEAEARFNEIFNGAKNWREISISRYYYNDNYGWYRSDLYKKYFVAD